MNKTELRDYVWKQTDTDQYQLPSDQVDNYLIEAFNRTVAATNRWPVYEMTWTLTRPTGLSMIELPLDVNIPAIMSLVNQSTDQPYRLDMINHETAEDIYVGVNAKTQSYPSTYSVWQNQIFLWPPVSDSEEGTFQLRGYRQPLSWLKPDDQTLDIDVRLTRPLAHYACALAYAAQEDEQLENVYMQRWQRDVELGGRAILDPAQHRPLAYGGDWYTPIGPGSSRGIAAGIVFNLPSS